MSCQTSTWASVAAPAPIPIVGIDRLRVTRSARSLGTTSSTIANAPAASMALASLHEDLAVLAAALHPVAAELVDRLRGQAQVRHHGDAGRDQRLDLRQHAGAALELDGLDAGLLHEPGGGLQRLLRARPGRSRTGGRRPPGRAIEPRTTAAASGSRSSTVTGTVES